VAAEEDQIVISDIEVTRAELIRGTDDTYRVGMYIYLNNTGREGDDLKVTVTSFSENEDGSVTVTNKNAQEVGERDKLEMSVRANSGDTIRVTVTGTQKLAKGVYFYEPEGGRGSSQSLVGIGYGETNVSAEKEFRFVEDMGEMGLRIYKTELGSGSPLSDITFSIYEVITEEGDTISETPTEEELAKYKTDENKVASVTTDVTGYAGITLDSGTYLITEEFNEEKVKAPIAPFYLMIPMSETVESDDGTVITETVNIVSIYPKNETVPPPEEPPVIPPTPDNVTGSFEILKYDEADATILLKGAQFEVYRPATSADTDTVTIQCDGIQYAVVPVMFNGEKLVLTTDEDGRASSPEMSCGTYFLVEAKAPAGYNLPEEAFSVMVVSSVMTTQVTVEVANQRGSILPETGGAGTRLFCIIGGTLTLGAVVLLVTKRRMTFAEQDE